MKKGPLAGYEIVGCKMCLNDGSYHPVDSSEMAFRTAGRDAFIEAFRKDQIDEGVFTSALETVIVRPEKIEVIVQTELAKKKLLT